MRAQYSHPAFACRPVICPRQVDVSAPVPWRDYQYSGMHLSAIYRPLAFGWHECNRQSPNMRGYSARQAIAVDSGMHGPRVDLNQRIVLVNYFDSIRVVL